MTEIKFSSSLVRRNFRLF